MALNYYAQPRMTRDIDLVLEIGRGDVDKVVGLFHPAYYVSREAVVGAVANRSLFNVIHQRGVIKVDCIVRKEGAYRQTEFERRQRVTLEGFALWIVSKEDLILSKLAWGKSSHSETQLRDVRHLLATGSDRAYLERWAPELGVRDLLEECRHD